MNAASGIFQYHIFQLTFRVAQAFAQKIKQRLCKSKIAAHYQQNSIRIQLKYFQLIVHSISKIASLRLAGQARFAKQTTGTDNIFNDVFFLA